MAPTIALTQVITEEFTDTAEPLEMKKRGSTSCSLTNHASEPGTKDTTPTTMQIATQPTIALTRPDVNCVKVFLLMPSVENYSPE